MCGRNSLFIDQADLEARFDAEVVAAGAYTPRYNIAPGEDLPFNSERIPPFTAGVNRISSGEKPPRYCWS